MRVLILHEKHGDTLLDASTDEALEKAVRSVLKARMTAPKGYHPWYAEPEKPEPELSVEQIEALPPGRLRDQAWVDMREYMRELDQYKRDVEWYTQVKDCLAGKPIQTMKRDNTPAWSLLRERTDYEYEGAELEEVHATYSGEDDE